MKKFSFGHFVAVVLICTAFVSLGVSLYVNQLTQKLEKETFLLLKEFADQDAQQLYDFV